MFSEDEMTQSKTLETAPAIKMELLSDEEAPPAREQDPLLVRPLPPRGRIPAVLAIRPEIFPHKLTYERHRGRPVILELKSAVMLGKLPPKPEIEKKEETMVKNEEIDLPASPIASEWREDDPVAEYLEKSNTDEDYLEEKTKKKKKKKQKREKLESFKLEAFKIQSCNRPNCDFSSHSRATMNSHKREVHRNSRDYMCSQCDYGSSSAADLRKHVRVHSGELPYECSQPGCDFKGRHANSLDYHQKKVHPTGDPMKCEIQGCLFSTYIPIALKNHHIKKHGNGKTIACDLCAYRCYLVADLRKHLRMHSGETPYACDWPGCGYACKISSNLRKHKRIHTEERPYSCDLCPFRSNFVSSLKAHKRIHTNERPFCCEQCGYRCNSTSNLKKHIMQKHPGTTYSGPGSTGAALRAAKLAQRNANMTDDKHSIDIIKTETPETKHSESNNACLHEYREQFEKCPLKIDY